MQDSVEIVLVGYSGHAYVVYDAALLSENKIVAYCDVSEAVRNPFDLNYLGSERNDSFDWHSDRLFALGIGDNNLRVRIGEFILSKNKELVTIVHPKSTVSSFCSMGKGVFVNAGAIVNAFSTIGDMCIINSGAIVEHECVLEKGVHIAPGAVLAGNVNVGQQTFIGANAVVRQGIKIGKNCIIGAGSVVVKDIADNSIVYGNPAS
ncbi:acetyltransferase [Myroides sp. NP-2]|uniref:acetyltransferase n=1 Tax=Myroides sp. NP-2 TaxID=2759945 RepID=UPI0015F81B5B|nr:acetyltransferase [Myroides sp. NP-2]